MADEVTPPVAPVTDPVTPQTPAPAEVTTEPVAEPTQPDAAEIDRIRAALNKANKEAEKLRLEKKEREDAQLSEIEKARRDADEAAQKLARYERDNLRQKVALETGLPAKWVGRLQGDSEEELAADAASILADLNKSRQPAPDPSQGPRVNALSEDDQLYESIYGKG